MNLNKAINVLSKMVILGVTAGLVHLFYFKFIANPFSPTTLQLLATYSLKYFNTWVLISPILIIVFLLLRIIWNLLFKNASTSNIKEKIQFYGSVLLGCIVGCLFLVYGGWIINHYFLPYKFHPVSLLADAGILLLSIIIGWIIWVILNANRDNKFKKLIIRYYKFTAFVLALSLLGLNSYVFVQTKKIPKRPNVIFILIDALRADHLTSYGYSRNTSPYIDSIGREGILFTRAISSAPWTVPSVVSMFTSAYPSVHGVLRNSAELGVLSYDFITLSERLLESGYETAGFVSNPWLNESYKVNQGFNTYKNVDWKDAYELTSRAIDWLDNRPTNPFFLSWLDSRSSIPFFLYLHYMDVHGPYDKKIPSPFNKFFLENNDTISDDRTLTAEEFNKIPDYWGVKDLQKDNLNFYVTLYDQEIRFVDDQIKKLMDRLDSLGLLNNTIIVITADHGVEFLEHGGWDMGKTLYDENLHIPLIMKLPSKLARNGIIDNQVRSIDIMPTLLGILNIPIPGNINGENLGPLIFQKRQLNLDAFSEAIENDPKNYVKSLRTEGFKLIYDTHTQGSELYDLETDPKESHDLNQDLTQNEMKSNRFKTIYDLLNSNIKTNSHLRKFYGETGTLKFNEEMKKELRSLGYVQ